MNSRFFQDDHPVNEALSFVCSLLELNLLWLVCSLPVITIGASSAALYSMCFRLLEHREGRVAAEFWKCFREQLRSSVPYTLTLLAGGIILILDFHILGRGNGSWDGIYYGVCLFLAAAFLAVMCYAIPLFSHFSNTFAGTMNNAWRLAAAKLPLTGLLLLIHCLVPALILSAPSVFFGIFWIWLCAGRAVSCCLASRALRPLFRELEEKA